MSLLSRRRAHSDGAIVAGSAPIQATRSGADWPGGSRSRARPGIFRTCANPYCAAGWIRLWRKREAPVFEGGWCCSEACTAAQVEAAVGRELDARGGAQESHRHRIPLGLAMMELGWITHAELRAALSAQRSAGAGRLGHWLMRQKSASEEQVTRALGLQWSCPVLTMEFPEPDELTPLVPRLFVDAFGALPLRVSAGRIVYLGFEDRPDPALALAVERVTGLRVESGIVEESRFRPAQSRMLAAQFPSVELMEAASSVTVTTKFTKAVENARPVEARLARVHDCLWLRMWLCPQRGPLPERGSVCDLIASATCR
jgi:Type II secretion system (T2SS), protein E, N-terminal domain